MEEKERYEWFNQFDNRVVDNNELAIIDVVKRLNQQDKEIIKLKEKIKQLKQSQKQLAIEELEMFSAMLSRAVLWDNDYECWTIGDEVYDSLMEQIDDKIKEFKGEK